MRRFLLQSFLHTDRQQKVAVRLHNPTLLAVDTLDAPHLVEEKQIFCITAA